MRQIILGKQRRETNQKVTGQPNLKKRRKSTETEDDENNDSGDTEPRLSTKGNNGQMEMAGKPERQRRSPAEGNNGNMKTAGQKEKKNSEDLVDVVNQLSSELTDCKVNHLLEEHKNKICEAIVVNRGLIDKKFSFLSKLAKRKCSEGDNHVNDDCSSEISIKTDVERNDEKCENIPYGYGVYIKTEPEVTDEICSNSNDSSQISIQTQAYKEDERCSNVNHSSEVCGQTKSEVMNGTPKSDEWAEADNKMHHFKVKLNDFRDFSMLRVKNEPGAIDTTHQSVYQKFAEHETHHSRVDHKDLNDPSMQCIKTESEENHTILQSSQLQTCDNELHQFSTPSDSSVLNVKTEPELIGEEFQSDRWGVNDSEMFLSNDA